MVENQLNADGPLRIGRGRPLVKAAGLLGLDAAHEAVVAGIFHADALGQHHFDVAVVEVNGREAHAGADDIHDFFQVLARGFVVHAGGQGGLVNLHMAHGVHEQIGELICGVLPFTGNAAHAHVDEGLIAGEEFGAVLGGEPHHLAHLDEHAAGDVESFIGGEPAGLDVLLVERIHILVHAANGHAGLILFHNEQGFDRENGLHGFPEGGGGVGGNTGVDFGDLLKLGPADRILFFSGQLSGVFRHAPGVDDDALGCVDDRLVEVDFVEVIRIGVIQSGEVLFCFTLNIQHALLHKDDVVAGIGVASAVQGVVGAVRDEGFAGESPHSGFAVLGLAVFVNGFSFPVGENFFSEDLLVFLGNKEGILGAVGDGIQFIPEPAPGNVGGKSAGAGRSAGSAHDEFVVLNNERSRLAAVTESLCPEFDTGQAGILPGDLGDGAGSVDGNGGYLTQVIALQEDMTRGGAVRNVIRTGG